MCNVTGVCLQERDHEDDDDDDDHHLEQHEPAARARTRAGARPRAARPGYVPT